MDIKSYFIDFQISLQIKGIIALILYDFLLDDIPTRNIHVFLISSHSIKHYFIAAIVPLKSKIVFSIKIMPENLKRWTVEEICLSLIKHLHTYYLPVVEPFQNATPYTTSNCPTGSVSLSLSKDSLVSLSFSRLTFLLNP